MPEPNSVDGTIVRTYQVNASPERVYEAFTNKKDLEMWKADDYEIEPRKGGKYKMGLESDGYAVTGEFLELVPNEKIVYSWKMTEYDENTKKPIPHWSNDKPTKVTVKFEKAGNQGTKITLIHEGFPERDEQYYMHEVGWDLLVGQVLKAYLEKSRDEFNQWWAEREPTWQQTWQKMSEDRINSAYKIKVEA
jgi:uncharacterized protein YndB with AHSA1/START domain